jgi:hypothetical protein
MGIFAVEGASGQRLVEILEPMGADQVGVVGDPAEIARIGEGAFAFFADPGEPFPEQPAIDRAEMKLADQRRLAERTEPRPLGGVIGNRASIAIEAHDIAPAGAGLDRLRSLPGKTAAEIEVAGIMAVQGFCHCPVVGVGKAPTECRQIPDHRRIVEGPRRQREPGGTEIIP